MNVIFMYPVLKMASFHKVVLIYLVFILFYKGKTQEQFNVFDKIKSGFKMAGEFLSSDHASKVANLVSKALGGNPTHEKSKQESNNIFSGFLRLFGFESRQISAIAVNAIILVAELVGSSLKIPNTKLEHRNLNEDNPFNWMMKNSVISNLISDTEDRHLPEKVINYITENSLDEETGCVQLLLCKMKPFVSEMQRALKERGSGGVKKGNEVLFKYFPNASVIADNGDKCEKKYYYCSIPL